MSSIPKESPVGEEKQERRRKGRAEQYALQEVAARLLPHSATAKCLRARGHAKQPNIAHNVVKNRATWAGLQTCKSVWACPVCARRISLVRAGECSSAIKQHLDAEGAVTMLTLTIPHTKADRLADLLARLSAALRSFTGHRATRATLAAAGYIGMIRNLEVTHGRRRTHNNGWHPHNHAILFIDAGTDIAALEEALYQQWRSAVMRAGLSAPSRKGFSLQNADSAGEYVAKWGLAQELSMSDAKDARAGGESPFQLLAAAKDPADRQAADLFKEYAAACKGKQQIVWSAGLKEHFGIGEVEDATIAEAPDTDDADVIRYYFKPHQWHYIKRNELRAILLTIVERRGFAGLDSYFAEFHPHINDERFEEWNNP